MVNASRAVYDNIPELIKLARSIADTTTDPVLKERLYNLASVPKNYAVQLKIISSVKVKIEN